MFVLLLLPSALLLVVAVVAMLARRSWARRVARSAEMAALASCAIAVLAGWHLATGGAATLHGPGLMIALPSLRVDIVSVIMTLLVSFTGWVVLRFSATYLDQEARHNAFTGWLCATLASVLILVMAGDSVTLAAGWIITSLCLHRLLLFYPARPAARRAARKKFLIARLSDCALVAGLLCLFLAFDSVDIATMAERARAGETSGATSAAAMLLAIAAILKSAQFPCHGWLTEVMETPTPVSALLHAGIINGGGFLLIRFADIVVTAPATLAALALIGGFTALFGAMVMLTQPAAKTALAWSTIAQMGFMVMQCGLGLFALALLHIVAHSLYKAHAFLSAGGAVERIAATRRPGPVAVPGVPEVARAFAAALAIYALLALLFGYDDKPAQAVALGAILIFGIAYLLAQGLADKAPRALTRRLTLYAAAASLSYFVLQGVAMGIAGATLPPPPAADPLQWVIMALALLSFGAIAFAQALFPHWATHPAFAGLRVHLSNGLYANAMLDRALGAWSSRHQAAQAPQPSRTA